MPDRPRYYLTTSIAYANNKPGLHTLYEVIAADAIARWHRMLGDDTRFLTGTDEHSINIAQAAVDEGRPTREFVDEKVALFKAAESALAISPGVDGSFVKEVADDLPAGGSALFLLIKDGDIGLLIAALRRYEGRVRQTTLDEEAEQALEDALH